MIRFSNDDEDRCESVFSLASLSCASLSSLLSQETGFRWVQGSRVEGKKREKESERCERTFEKEAFLFLSLPTRKKNCLIVHSLFFSFTISLSLSRSLSLFTPSRSRLHPRRCSL